MSEPLEQPNNAVLEVKLDYISKDITVIKADIKEIKSDFIARREFNDAISTLRKQIVNPSDHESRIRALETRVWKFIGALVVAQSVIIPVILYMFYKSIK
jgi:hypothetical protein